MTRKICPRHWKYAKITTKENEIYYKKIRKLNQYSHGINIPKEIESKFEIQEAISKNFPFHFSTKIIKETNSYYYFVIPFEIRKILNLKNGEIIHYKLNKNHENFGKLRKKGTSLIITLPKKSRVNLKIKGKIICSILDKLKLETPPKKINSKFINNKEYFELKTLLPKITSRDEIPFKIYEPNNENILVCCEFKQVKGLGFKCILLPKYVNANKISLFFGLMHSDGFKKFGYKEIYGKYIKSPFVGFVNGEPGVIKLFLDLFEELFSINREHIQADLKFPLKIDKNQKEKLRKFWEEMTDKRPGKIYKDIERDKKWCPAGIINLGLYDILMAEIIISSLKEFIRRIDEFNNGIKRRFMTGILIGDGSPILIRNKITRVMISIEFKEEGDIYTHILNSLGYKARNLYTEKMPHRLVDIGGGIKGMESIIKELNFGFWEGDKYYGSLEKHYKLLKGHKNHSKSTIDHSEDFIKLDLMLKTYINDLSTLLPIPKYYENIFK